LGKKALELMEAAAQLKILSAENTKEQELTYRLAAQLQTERESRTNDVRMLRLRNLKDQAMHLRNELHRRKTECEKIINHLNLFADDVSVNVNVATCVNKLKEHSEKLTQGLDCLQEVYQSRIKQVVDADLTQRIDLDIEMDLGDPQLSPQESEALRLLAIIGISSSSKTSSKNSVSTSSNESADSRRDLEGSISWSQAENNKLTRLSRLEDKVVGSSIQPTAQRSLDRKNVMGNSSLASLYVEKGPINSSLLDDKTVGSSIHYSVKTTLKRNSFMTGSLRQKSGPGEKSLDLLQGSINRRDNQPETVSRLSNTDRLLNKLQLSFPSLSLEDLSKYIMNIRQLNNGKISGLSVETIKMMVSEMLAQEGKIGGLEMEHKDTDCTICYEMMTESNSRFLDPCKHRFHDKCINDWMGSSLGAGNTCPICRDYIVQEDEFPVLS